MADQILSIKCPSCGKKLVAKLKPKPGKGACPKCKATFSIPACDLDGIDPRVSKATPEDIIDAFNNREEGAILITFDPYAFDCANPQLAKMKLAFSHTDNCEDELIKTIMVRLAGMLIDGGPKDEC